MNFDSIFINGDSYSAQTEDFLVYADYLGEYLNLPVINLSARGSSNDRIIRSSVEYLCRAKNPLVIIGWSFIRRIEVWYYGENQNIISQIPDRHPEEHLRINLISLNWLLNANEATLEQKALINEDLFVHKKLIDFYTNLYLFTDLLKSRNLKYLFFSAAKNSEVPIASFPAIANLDLVKSVMNDPGIYQLHEFYIQQWAQKNDPDCNDVTGHLSAEGHKKFAKHLLELLNL